MAKLKYKIGNTKKQTSKARKRRIKSVIQRANKRLFRAYLAGNQLNAQASRRALVDAIVEKESDALVEIAKQNE